MLTCPTPPLRCIILVSRGLGGRGCQPSGNRRTPAPFWADSRRAEWGRSKPGTLQLICLRGTFCFYFALYKSSTYMWFISSNAQERCKMKSKSFTVLTFLRIQFSGTKYIYVVMQPSPPSLLKTFLSPQTETIPIKHQLLTPLPQPLASTILLIYI